jgi:hypothetical protein
VRGAFSLDGFGGWLGLLSFSHGVAMQITGDIGDSASLKGIDISKPSGAATLPTPTSSRGARLLYRGPINPHNRSAPHSARSAISGSTFVALRAGR